MRQYCSGSVLNFSQVKVLTFLLGYIVYERQVVYMAKRYKKPSVPRTKRVYNDEDKTIMDTRIPDLNGVREYTQPVHNAIDKTSVCKYCSKSIVRGYICYDCRDLETPVKKQSFEERQAIEEGLLLLQQIRNQEAVIRQEDRENNNTVSYKATEIMRQYCKKCGLVLPIETGVCDFNC